MSKNKNDEIENINKDFDKLKDPNLSDSDARVNKYI